MKPKLTLLVVGSSLCLAASTLLAQINLATNVAVIAATNLAINVATNLSPSTKTNDPTRHGQEFGKRDQSLLPSGLKERMGLTKDQQTELKTIEDYFASTALEYRRANQPRIDAAEEAISQARAAKDKAQIQAAQNQLQQVWAGLQSDRDAALAKVKLLLTPAQLKILHKSHNDWRENDADVPAVR